jgi:hypothetical protein
MFVRDRRLAMLCLVVPVLATIAVAGCSAADDQSKIRPLAGAVTEGSSSSNETSIALPGPCGAAGDIVPDRCDSKEDGVYCSVISDFAAYECKGGQVLKGLQCGSGKCLGADLGGNIQCGQEGDQNQGLMGAAPPGPKDPLTTYAEECQADVGLMPEFDCMDFPELDTLQDGSKLTVREDAKKALSVVRADGKALQTMADGSTPRCDDPSWASTPCWPGTRVGVVSGQNGSTWAVLCRRQRLQLSSDKNFDLVGVIAHNAKTGGTCFFDKARGKPLTKTDFPQPGATAKKISTAAQLTWMPPAKPPAFENCLACHGAGPFIRSSYLPKEIRRKLSDAMDPTGAYKIIGSVFGKEWKVTTPQELAPAGGSCSDGCHRIANLPQSMMFAHLTFGGPEIDNKSSDSRLAKDGKGQPTRWPLGYFMPPDDRGKGTLATWTKDNGAERDEMLKCFSAKNPKAAGCTLTAFIDGL